MLVFKVNWLCMDCKREFAGYVDDDNDVILCPKCGKAFEIFVGEDESRSFTLFWWREFTNAYGYAIEREERRKFKFLEELLT